MDISSFLPFIYKSFFLICLSRTVTAPFHAAYRPGENTKNHALQVPHIVIIPLFMTVCAEFSVSRPKRVNTFLVKKSAGPKAARAA